MIMKIAVGFQTLIHIEVQPVIVHNLKFSLTSISKKGILIILQLAAFLEECDNIISYVKNYLAVHFTIDYVNANGDIS